ncbi:MAG: ubiquinol-cytochrome c reductase iron-sulfur subunit [bacterium]|jgi:cytochrome b6-f complex iron-sulfur subunit
MERKEFINKITGGLTLTCVACMMQACSKDDDATNSNSNGGGNTAVLLTVNLSNELTSVGDFVSRSGIIVVRIAAGNEVSSFNAFSNVCPHAGATVTYIQNTNSFNCSAHDSNFSISGSVTGGPATTGLVKKMIVVSGTTLTVK